MAATLKIDGFDFYQYVRVAPGEGFDPASPGFQEPQFGETTIGDSQPLISIAERNKEMSWPVHLNAASKDALHNLLISINRRLAAAREVEWKDDGATNSTFYDVVFARFDPDYNYRRAQRSWLSGVLRIWVKPYGRTGTYRLIGTTAGGSWGMPGFIGVPAASLIGDVPAFFVASNQNVAPVSGSVALCGVSVMPTTAQGFYAAGDLFHGGATITQSTSAIASITVRNFVNGATYHTVLVNNTSGPSKVDIPAGRNHFVAVIRTTATTAAASGIAVYCINSRGNGAATSPIIGATVLLPASVHWKLVDLGVYSQPTSLSTSEGYKIVAGFYGGTSGSATGAVDICGLYVLPEQSTIFSTELGANRQTFTEEGVYCNITNNIIDTKIVGQQPRLPVGSNMKVMYFRARELQSLNGAYGPHSLHAQERFSYAR